MFIRAFAVFTALGCSTFLLTGCGGSGSGSGSSAPPPAKPQYIYSDGVVNGNAAVLSFPLTATGTSVEPTVAATPGSTDVIRAMSTDGNGNLYVMTYPNYNFSETAVYVYAMSEGALALERSFTTESVGSIGGGMTVDHNGTVYISVLNGTVAAFDATANGAATPTGIYNVGTTLHALATDATGNIYAEVAGSLLINEYPAGFTSLTPIKTFTIPTPPFDTADTGLCVDSRGTLYSAAFGEIAVFADGSTSATSTITGSNTDLTIATTVATDSTGRIWVNNGFSPRFFDAFAADANGNVAPIDSFESPPADFTGTNGTSLVIY